MLTSILNFYLTTENLPFPSTIATWEPLTAQTEASPKFPPIKNLRNISPVISAQSSIVLDLNSGVFLYEKDIHTQRPIASITKLMTSILILEENKLDEIVTISENAANTEGSTMNLQAGEKISLENLLYATIIHSANDAAMALAEHNAGNTEKFVEKMNKKAKDIGMSKTNFSNPTGLDDPNNYSSVHDIALLGTKAYQLPFIQKAATTKEMEVKSITGDLSHKLESTNKLLYSYLQINGLKTGSTDQAGQCLVAIASNQDHNQILTVVLNSPDRFQESKSLIDWTFKAYTWPNLTPSNAT